MTVEPFDPHGASDSVLRGVHLVNTESEFEDFPDDPPMSYEDRLARLLAPVPSNSQLFRWVASDGGEVVAMSYVLRWPTEDPDTGYLSVRVRPEHRRRGVGSRLLEVGLEVMAAEGSERLIVDCVDGRPWESELVRLGFENVLNDRRSRVYMADIDWDLMERWVEKASEKALSYDLVSFASPVPEEYLERFCEVHNVMNTAPLEGLEIADRTMTPEKWRSIESMLAGRGDTKLATVAVHRPTGVFVGYTDVTVSPGGDRAAQDDTGVDPNHRNLGLGRWLKATMAKRLRSEFPGVKWIDTSNVQSNAAMLAINVEMGFKPILFTNAWQGDLGTVRTNLGLRL